MQLDFHHAVTYVLARIAGFDKKGADTIAYAAQYVDDATESGTLRFDNGASYTRTSSAHKMLDYRNFEELANALVWVPFHFLPGNAGFPAGQDPDGSFIHKLIARPNSPVARDMLRATCADGRGPWALHRLGIAMHTYADTWAHQGFAGVAHVVNHAKDVTDDGGKPDDRLLDKLKSFFLNDALPLGHGTVLSNPDKPWMRWAYTDGLGRRIERDNPRDFLDAADHMVRAMRGFRQGDVDARVDGLGPADADMLAKLFVQIVADSPEERHRAWALAIARGAFSFGPDSVTYVEDGPGSWHHAALGAGRGRYDAGFLQSDWKFFHDALQAHRFDVLHRILPVYGICIG